MWMYAWGVPKEYRMKKNQVHIGGTFVAKVSAKLATVRIDAESRFGGWEATNVSTRRNVRIKSAQRLRREVSPVEAGGLTAAETPPQDIDERLAAAPPSIVPYEQRRARAEAAQSEARKDGGPRYDPSRCATKRCKGTPVMTYLECPLCQACWDRQCGEDPSSEVSETAGDACRPVENPETPEQEKVMPKKKSNKKQTKSRPVTAKAKVVKKAVTQKAKAVVAAATKTPKAKKPAGEQKPKRVSALDAAAQVLAKVGKPMRAQELITAMAAQGLWTSPAGKTPHATLYAAMTREERDKGEASRFRKVDRGQFAFHKAGS